MISLMRLVLRYMIVVVCSIIIVFSTFQLLFSNPSESKTKHQDKHLGRLFDYPLLQNLTLHNTRIVLNNKSKFSSLSNEDLVIVIQVHNRLNYLKNLIASLSNVRYINETLIVFSHDIYDENINNLVRDISFAKTVQIFFPFSIQIWHDTFPGTSAGDCKKDVKPTYNCTNAKHADSYGHYRESHITQTKHHWFWKLNYVFEYLPYTKDHNGDLVLIEEDHYISPDFVHTWKLMKQSKKKLKSEGTTNVDILTLGHYDQKYNIQNDLDKFNFIEWFSGKHNMAFTINRILWSKIKACTSEFCTYDDYNWDWTLMYVFGKCLRQKIFTLIPVVPRAYHIGSCGVHHKEKNCVVDFKIQTLNHIFEKYDFFIPKISVIKLPNRNKVRLKNNGGWADPRDRRLCNQYGLPFEDIIRKNPDFVFQKLLNLNL